MDALNELNGRIEDLRSVSETLVESNHALIDEIRNVGKASVFSCVKGVDGEESRRKRQAIEMNVHSVNDDAYVRKYEKGKEKFTRSIRRYFLNSLLPVACSRSVSDPKEAYMIYQKLALAMTNTVVFAQIATEKYPRTHKPSSTGGGIKKKKSTDHMIVPKRDPLILVATPEGKLWHRRHKGIYLACMTVLFQHCASSISCQEDDDEMPRTNGSKRVTWSHLITDKSGVTKLDALPESLRITCSNILEKYFKFDQEYVMFNERAIKIMCNVLVPKDATEDDRGRAAGALRGLKYLYSKEKNDTDNESRTKWMEIMYAAVQFATTLTPAIFDANSDEALQLRKVLKSLYNDDEDSPFSNPRFWPKP